MKQSEEKIERLLHGLLPLASPNAEKFRKKPNSKELLISSSQAIFMQKEGKYFVESRFTLEKKPKFNDSNPSEITKKNQSNHFCSSSISGLISDQSHLEVPVVPLRFQSKGDRLETQKEERIKGKQEKKKERKATSPSFLNTRTPKGAVFAFESARVRIASENYENRTDPNEAIGDNFKNETQIKTESHFGPRTPEYRTNQQFSAFGLKQPPSSIGSRHPQNPNTHQRTTTKSSMRISGLKPNSNPKAFFHLFSTGLLLSLSLA